MKTVLLLFLSCGILIAEPLTLKLEYKEAGEENYPEQIQEAFTKLLAKDTALAKEFTQFEAPPDSGRYYGVPTIIPIVISEEEHVNFRDTGGEREFQKTIAFYYRFAEGQHHGIATSSGFFALFTVTGKLTYRQLANNDFDLSRATVLAKFQGFSRTLSSAKPNGS